jgi:hypothetical protein
MTVPLMHCRAISLPIFRLKLLAQRPIHPNMQCMEFSNLEAVIEQHA